MKSNICLSLQRHKLKSGCSQLLLRNISNEEVSTLEFDLETFINYKGVERVSAECLVLKRLNKALYADDIQADLFKTEDVFKQNELRRIQKPWI